MSQIATPRDKIVFFPGGTSTAGVTSTSFDVFGGYYGWHIEGNLNGCTVALQFLGDDGTTWFQLGAARTTNDAGATPANTMTPVLIAGPARMRVVISVAAPVALYTSLNRFP